MKLKDRYDGVISWFRENMPVAETELRHNNPYQLMVAVILSAQCTDKRVNLITPAFFNAFPDVRSLAEGSFEEVFGLIRSCSYPNNKARHLLNGARYIVDQYKGSLPAEVDELMKIPGLGRKSANVIASVAFAKAALAVDTHVFRVSARIGLTKGAKNPLETERQLTRNIPESLHSIAHHWLILHGRYVCRAKNPRCGECGLTPFCKYYAGMESRGSSL